MSQGILLDNSNAAIQYLKKKDRRLSKVVDIIGPIKYYLHDNPYEFIVHEIIEQMLSKKVGNRIFDRLNVLCAGSITVNTINRLKDSEIKSCGMSGAKVSYIRSLNEALLSDALDFRSISKLPDDQVVKELTQIKGIGSWTAKMYLIFVLNRPDVLPTEDGAFLQAYRWLYKTNDCKPSAVERKCAKWKPYSSIASRYMYRVLDTGLTRTEFHLFKEA